MELTQKTFADRLTWLRSMVLERTQEFAQYRDALHEKGVECAIIVPMLEVILDFDTMRDVHYEEASETKHRQRFDFLIDGKFLIEAKMLGANLDEHYKQLERYIKGNDHINYGILTNGIDHQIWIQKSFIEKFTKSNLPHTPAVARVLEISLETDSVPFLLSTLALFAKPKYEDSFATIARIAGHYAAGGLGKPPVLHEDKEDNKTLRDRIREAVAIKKGIYYKDVMEGKRKAGDSLRFSDDSVEITVEVTRTGTVQLKRGCANILNMLGAMESGWGPMVQLVTGMWSQSDSEFQDPLEIIKLAQDKQKLWYKERYEFKRVALGA